ncbi:MAG: transposase [Bacteroidales bacterium]|nr:transposase [Bacteroidales bacterium]
MRRPRIKVDGEGIYHVVSRIGGRRFLLDDKEKGILLGMIRRAAAFSGVEVYTYAMMDNHFHLLVRVSGKRDVTEAELRWRVVALYGKERGAQMFAEWEKREGKGKSAAVELEKDRLKKRMHDLSQFCKTFKEAYTQDYNRRHGNTGTIWEGRFKSLLLEGSARALLTVAGYIHLNPVRAGTAKKAEEAGNTGYGAACGGDAAARDGLDGLASRARGKAVGKGEKVGWPTARDVCRNTLDGKMGARVSEVGMTERTGEETSFGADGGDGRTVYGLLRHRHACFLHGGVLGGEDFVKTSTAMFPPRVRRKSEGELDRWTELGLSSAMGVRDAV